MNSTVVKSPLPAGIVAPENEKPRTVPFVALVDVVKPASAADPPVADVGDIPDKSN